MLNLHIFYTISPIIFRMSLSGYGSLKRFKNIHVKNVNTLGST